MMALQKLFLVFQEAHNRFLVSSVVLTEDKRQESTDFLRLCDRVQILAGARCAPMNSWIINLYEGTICCLLSPSFELFFLCSLWGALCRVA